VPGEAEGMGAPGVRRVRAVVRAVRDMVRKPTGP
jgi:hypothetical protein